WVPGTSPWPWVLIAVALFAAALAAAGGSRPPTALAVVPLVAVLADVVHTAGALLASTVPLATELYGSLTSAAVWAVAGFGAYRLLRGKADTGLLYLLLGGVFLTLAGAVPDLAALGRSQVVSGFGPGAAPGGTPLNLRPAAALC